MKKFVKWLVSFLYDVVLFFLYVLEALWNLILKTVKFLKNWNEFITVPLAFVLFWFSRPFLRWLDPTSGVFDTGVLHVFFAGLVIYLLAVGAVWLILRITYKVLYVYLDLQFETDFKTLTNYQKCVLSIGFFSVLLLGFAITLTAL